MAYFSVLADAIRLDPSERPDGVRYATAPALKIGRIGVATPYQEQGVGRFILDLIVGFARRNAQRMGLRYVTLDALPRPQLVGWYERYGFERNSGDADEQRWWRWWKRRTPKDRELPHVSMRYDILLQSEVRADGP